jgi:hypothetical protein
MFPLLRKENLIDVAIIQLFLKRSSKMFIDVYNINKDSVDPGGSI